jgi:predicted sulfurtransferase
MHHFLLHLAPDPREPFFYQDRLQVDYQDVEDILKEFDPCNLSLSNHQSQKTQEQCHRKKTCFTQHTRKVPTIKKKKKRKKERKQRKQRKQTETKEWV